MDLLDAALALHRDGRLSDAEALYRRALAERPDDAEALHLLGMLCHQTGRNDEALVLLPRSVALAPAAAHFHSNLGGVLARLGMPSDAEPYLRRAVRLRPDSPDAHNNLGVVLDALGRRDEADEALRTSLRLRPDHAETHNNLGNVLQKRGPLAGAVAAYRTAVALRAGDYPDAQANLASALCELGKVEEAVACFRSVVGARPQDPQAHSNLLFALHYRHGDDGDRMHREHLLWAERHSAPLRSERRPHDNDRSRHRRLRIGYVSPDFRAHPVTRFFEPVLRHRDTASFEVYCYSDTAEPDAVTQRLSGMADVWRNVRGLSDASLADHIRQDRIDILVDLAGHMAANRLPVFARKPAPVQVSYLGYPDTTGVDAVDYRITDSVHDPPGETEQFHAERLVRLEPCCWCYGPDPSAPDVGESPALRTGIVTFAVLNKPAKVTLPMVRAWAEILRGVPRARLLILGGAGAPLSEYNLLREGGLPADRVELVGRLPREQYLALYGRVDVALDTFPYNGHTTTCDALWMGVPTVTLPGRTHVSRAGLSVLSAAGVAGPLVAADPADYVSKALALAADPAALTRFRSSARERVAGSVLCDGPGHAAHLARAFRDMWSDWCG